MQIEVKGRNLQVTEELRELCAKRFQKIGKQVSDLAVLQVELFEERNPKNPVSQVAEVTLHLKGSTLRAREVSRDLAHAINLVAEDLARQVKRHRDKRTGRRDGRSVGDLVIPPDPADGGYAAPAA
jgi:putative sigma-54 modulation protein